LGKPDSGSGDLGYVRGLRTFLPLDDLELDLVAFLQALIAVDGDGAVMHENVRSTIAAEKTVSFCVVKPLDDAFQPFHDVLSPFCEAKKEYRILSLAKIAAIVRRKGSAVKRVRHRPLCATAKDYAVLGEPGLREPEDAADGFGVADAARKCHFASDRKREEARGNLFIRFGACRPGSEFAREVDSHSLVEETRADIEMKDALPVSRGIAGLFE